MKGYIDVNMCIHRQSLGSRANGAFAEYVRASERIVIPLDDAISFGEVALIEPLAYSVHALTKQVNLKPFVTDILPLDNFEETFKKDASVYSFKIIFDPAL